MSSLNITKFSDIYIYLCLMFSFMKINKVLILLWFSHLVKWVLRQFHMKKLTSLTSLSAHACFQWKKKQCRLKPAWP